MQKEFTYLIFYKPYNVLTQFTRERPEHHTLADYIKFDKDIYPVGRLDKDSEGLLLLTNDKRLNQILLEPANKRPKTYLVQVDGDITSEAIKQLQSGVEIALEDKTYHTKPCQAKKLAKPPVLPERNPPVRFRANIPTSWILITLTEGKNRQIRKMCAKVQFPVLRLVRVQLGDLTLGNLLPGKFRKISLEELQTVLLIKPEEWKKKSSDIHKNVKTESKKPTKPSKYKTLPIQKGKRK
ncbi:MAG: pseudouridine synthase [Saprospiraceae bacterium]|nr:pseudouridine synthase [Saprospiraceae bacterium]